MTITKTVVKTKFECLYESDDESEATDESDNESKENAVCEATVCVESAEGAPTTQTKTIFFVDYKTEQFKNQSIEDQKDQLGEYIYRIIATTHPEKAGAYTGSLLDLEVDHLIYIIETPSEMNEMLIRLVEANI
jgi:hypothetical protein